ncbi:MAG: hypothetical protein WAW06_10465, partial [bacterium]
PPALPTSPASPGSPASPASPGAASGGPGLLRRHWLFAAIALVAVAYLATLALLPLDGIWINDIGSRIIQVQGIVASDYTDYSIAWPGAEIDPSFDFAPLAYPFATIRGDRLFSVWSPFFAAVSSVFFRLAGYPGLYVLPFAASLALLAAVARLVKEVGGGARAQVYAVLLAGLATPLWFYSATFWEHTAVMALLVWAVVAFVRFVATARLRQACVAAALTAFAAYFRAEVYAFSLALLAVLIFYAPRSKLRAALAFCCATAAALVPLWLFHWWALGSPAGHHLATLFESDPISHLLARPKVFFYLFLGASREVWASLVLTMPFVILLLINPRLPERAFRIAIPLVGLAGAAFAVLVYACFFTTDLPVVCLGACNSLLPAAPILVLGLVRLKDQSPDAARRAMLWVLVVSYAAIYWLTVPEKASWGIHWGARYLLVVYPLLVVPCALNLEAWQGMVPWPGWRLRLQPGRRLGLHAGPQPGPRAGLGLGPRSSRTRALSWAAVTLLVGASLAAQVLSITILQRKMSFSSRLNREVAARAETVIVTDQWWVAQELYSVFYSKPIFLVGSQRAYDDLARRLAARGLTQMLYVTPAAPGEKLGPGTTRVLDGGLNYWSLDLVPVRIAPVRVK